MNDTQKAMVAEWVAALRSGDYEQGRNTLKTLSGQYCCLGVLAQLRLNKLDPTVQTDERGMYIVGLNDGGKPFPFYNSIPGENFDEWTGLGRATGLKSRLMSMNDEQRMSFNEIADYIEAAANE